MIELQNKALSCVIAPELGAAVMRLDVVKKGATYHVLRPTPDGSTDPREFALAHLAPIGGPVRHNKFKWDGKEKLLTPNLPDVALFTNGVAWQRPWEGKKDGRFSATLKYTHKNQPGWPFDFSIIAVFDLEEDHLIITYELANEGKQGICPVGVGSSMLLPKAKNTLISAGINTLWHMDENNVPTTMGEVPFNLDLKEGLTLDAVDTPQRWYSGWTGKASIDYAESRLSTMVKSEGDMPHLGFECHKSNDYFRLTALSHIPGALDMKGYDEDETGLLVIGPGETITAKIKVDVDLGMY